jgi:hypothetical protein
MPTINMILLSALVAVALEEAAKAKVSPVVLIAKEGKTAPVPLLDFMECQVR